VLRRTYENQNCSIARSLETIGERWTLLILRDAFLGTRRFDDFQKSLGVARNVLTVRLKSLVDTGLLERRRYQERPERYEYRLTEKGIDLWPVIVSMMQWGDVHGGNVAGPPMVLEHRGCGGGVDAHRICDRCGERLGARDVRAHPGPGADPDHPLTRLYERRAAAKASA
jgi:DNA-binding HxlR family transcriptional regulator